MMMKTSLLCLLVLTSLLCCKTHKDQRIIRAEPGDNVILTCRAAENKDVIVVEWSRTDLESDQYVVLYRDSTFFPDGQSPSFKDRVDLLDVENGDMSLVLKNVTTIDTGTYECRVVQEGNNERKILDIDPICIVNLRVEAGNQEKLKEDGGNKDGQMEDGGNKDGQKEDGGSCTGWIVGFIVGLVGFFVLVSPFGFLLYRNREQLCQGQNSSPAAGEELEPMNTENLPPAEK
ncbi:coxsackievirus and adenovirus receptor homolog isoform X2 [Fundulus heteroclitus]|uniref:coxsackievirus and adenovirus receptor homolog isoform X2 n=1 Tax=Fundulus heteroclitus TaxID=8078 RepID=UPI00165A450A|nr:coxsackievirus and adenovirus receptor homolog isoform X2 [Fundulus heteroclitus]